MDKVLNRICSISDHPVALFDEPFRIKYASGLGACLFVLSRNSPITKMMFIVWGKSVLNGLSVNASTLWKEDGAAIKAAISIQRRGLKLFSMRNYFFFDVLYLLEESLQGMFDLAETTAFLKNICNIFSKRALDNALAAVTNESQNAIDASLLAHRQRNIKYTNAQEKRVLIVANTSAGKSTLINALIGARLNKTLTTACTNKQVYIHNKQAPDGITIMTENGEYEYHENLSSISSDFSHAALPFVSKLCKVPICIIDTPGVNNILDSNHKKITENAIKSNEYDVLVYVSNCQYFGTNDEHNMLSFIKRNVKRPVLFVLNQLDRFKVKEDSVLKMINDYKTDVLAFGFDSPKIIPVSAKTAFLCKLDDKFLDDDDVYDKEVLKKRFQKDYYNLPSYISKTAGNNMDVVERTGIVLLENEILNLI